MFYVLQDSKGYTIVYLNKLKYLVYTFSDKFISIRGPFKEWDTAYELWAKLSNSTHDKNFNQEDLLKQSVVSKRVLTNRVMSNRKYEILLVLAIAITGCILLLL